MRRAVIYFVLAALAGLVGGVSLAGELGASVTMVDGVIVGTHTGRIHGSNGTNSKVYYVDVERQDTFEEESVRNAPFYDAYEASQDPDVTLEIIDVGSGVDRIAKVHYLGHTYDATTKAEGIGVSIAFLVLSAVFLGLGIRRTFVVRRRRRAPATVWAPPSSQPLA